MLNQLSLPLKGWESDENLTRAAELLREGAKVIDRHGWTQGHYGDERDGYCMAGALNEASMFTYDPFNDPVVIACCTFRRVVGLDITHWNDNHASTKEAVIAKMTWVADEIDRQVAA